jgi:AraC family transcriptional regulator, transcriptional activator of pobA
MPVRGNELPFSGKSDSYLSVQGRPLASDLIRAEAIESGLRSRIIGRADAVFGTSCRAVLLRRGEIEILSQGASTLLTGPAVAWLPWTDEMRLRIAAGSVGVHVLAGRAAVTNAIGYKAESADLRIASDHPIRLTLSGRGRAAETVAQCFDGILEEVHDNEASSITVIEAHLRILLISLWRMQGAPVGGQATAPGSRHLMTRFSTLLEAHFRERWTVGEFARRLGVSADRLTDTCRRTRGQPPKRLIDTRTATEARLLLEGSATSIDQIADALGFPSAAHFNRFFRRTVGTTPGRYREAVRARQADPGAQGAALHEWP